MPSEGKEHRVEYMRADDGAEIPVRVFGPDGDGTPLVMLHGIHSHSGWFTKSASFVASLGHPVYSFDRRGSGLSRETRGHVAHFRTVIDEARTVAAAALERHGKRRVHVLGHCFGAIPAALFACCHPDMVESLILPTPGIHTRTTVAPAQGIQIAILRVIRATRHVPFPLNPEDLADLETDRRLIRDDPLALHELTAGFCFETFRARLSLKRKMRRLTAPSFMALAARDRILDNPRTTALFHSIPSTNKKLRVYPNATHILEFSGEKDAFFRDLADWLEGTQNREPISKGKVFRTVTRSVARVAVWHAEWQLRQFLKGLPHCERVQDQFLARLLLANQDSDFGRQHGFARIRSYADFTGAVPLTHYGYHAPYIERCKSGDTKALLGPSQKLLMFAMTSGTTSSPKYIPVTSRFMAAYHRGWNIWIVKYLADHPEAYLRKLLQVSSPTETERTIGGHPCGAMSAAQARHQKRIVRYFYATPREVARITDDQARFYVTMRFALMGDVGTMVTPNPSTLILLAKTAESNAPALIRDIHDGGISESVELPSELRSRLIARLRPNPRRSSELEQLLQEHGRLLPRHYWNPAALGHWMGGTVGLYLPQIRQYFGDKPIRDIGLLASEGRMSIPLEDNTPAGPLDIFANFYEFISEEEISPAELCPTSTTLPDTLTVLRAHELKKGGQYFILLTNHTGLCRYHVGDIVRVTDFIGSTPVIEFLSRGTHTSSITGEKLTEHQVVVAVGDVMSQEDGDLATFTMAPVWADPPYYLLCFESRRTRGSDALAHLAERIDQKLGQINLEYRSKRQSRRLGALQIRPLARGTGVPSGRIHHAQHKHRFLFNQPGAHEETVS